MVLFLTRRLHAVGKIMPNYVKMRGEQGFIAVRETVHLVKFVGKGCSFFFFRVLMLTVLQDIKYYSIRPGFIWSTCRTTTVVSKTKHSKTKTEARSTQISKTKHPRSKTKHPKLENEDP